MSEEVRIWQVDKADALTEVKRSKLDLEARVERWLSRDISLLSSDLLVIGEQVATSSGAFIDLLCIDSAGSLVIVELKRDKTPREVTAQALDYASWVKDLGTEEIDAIAARRLKGTTLKAAFQAKFGADLPEVINEHHAMRIVASEIDDSTGRIIRYLAETYGVDINALRFQFFQAPDGREFLVRTFTVAPEVVEQTAGSGRGKRVRHTTQQEFLAALDQNGRAVFERIFERAGSRTPEMPIRWGTSGFSLNVDLGGTQVAVLFGYPPTSVYRQSIYTNRAGINARTQAPEEEIAALWNKAQATGLFRPAGRELKCSIDHAFTDEEIGDVLSCFEEMAGAIAKHGLKE
ncbi:MAG: DUF91 domain-containing protein [Bryobacteraceae bacterium]|nr:DUF91 domain-containing protein [Bryobacteraceae bacterium]